MARFTCPFASLDEPTQEYLREVRSRKGERCPGVYIERSNYVPFWAFILGIGIIPAGMWLVIGSSKDAWAVAMLMTAVLLFGGWLIAYAFRRWLGSSGKQHVGYFSYFDPTHAYEANGDEITVTDMAGLHNAEFKHIFSDGKYASSNLLFRVRNVPLVFKLKNRNLAEYTIGYYKSLLWLEEHEDPSWRSLPTGTRGGVARYVTEEDDLPQAMSLVSLEVTEVPTEPKQVGKPSSVMMPLLVLTLVASGIYATSLLAIRPTADSMAFEAAKGSAWGLRSYLLDERNTMYREEAKKLLAGFYEPAIQKARNIKDPNLQKGMLEILDDVKESATSVTSINVISNVVEGESWNSRMRTDLADLIAQHLGRDLIAFAMPIDNKPAHIELHVRAEGTDRIKFSWQLKIRKTPDSEPLVGAEQQMPRTYQPVEQFAMQNELRRQVFEYLFAIQPPPIIPAPVGGDWDN